LRTDEVLHPIAWGAASVQMSRQLRQIQQRRSGLNSPTPRDPQLPPGWHKEVLPVRHTQKFRKRVP